MTPTPERAPDTDTAAALPVTVDAVRASPHPIDGFSVVRFSVCIPDLGSPSPSSQDSDSDVDVDPYTRSQMQCVELCFHSGFLASPEPLSLHVSPSGCIQLYRPAPILHTPRPPHYIHELPDPVDLTASNSSCPPPSRGRPVALFFYLVAVLLCSLMLGSCLLSATALIAASFNSSSSSSNNNNNINDMMNTKPSTAVSGPRPTSFSSSPPHIITLSKNHQRSTYAFFVDNATTETLRLYDAVLPIERLRLSLLGAPLQDTLATINPELISELDRTVRYTCRNTSSYLATEPPPSAVPENLDRDIGLVCHSLSHRVRNFASSWRRLRTADSGNPVGNLRFTAWMLDVAARSGAGPTALAAAYSRGLMNPDQAPWLATCQLCAPSPNTAGDAAADAAAPTSSLSPSASSKSWPRPPDVNVPVASWHFACDPAFSQLGDQPAGSSIMSFLLSWGRRQSDDRFATLRSACLDVDGEPLYPNNQHPFHEADDIHSDLTFESDLLAMLRNLVELSTAIDDLIHLLRYRNLLPPTNTSPPSGHQQTDPKPREPLRNPWWHTIPSLLPVLTRLRTVPLAQREALAIRYGIEHMANIRNVTLVHTIRSLGVVAVGMTKACAMLAEQRIKIEELDAGRGWEHSEAALSTCHDEKGGGGSSSSSSGTAEAAVTTTIRVTRTIFTADLAAEASALRVEAASPLWQNIDPSPPPAQQTATTTETTEVRERTEPISEDEEALARRLWDMLEDEPLSQMTSWFSSSVRQREVRIQG
ncbi:hypothetical protein CT0861_13259 [Colletotrichum tofieldiae]|uniref:Uncharacterized protein n=1 Tax=Colletotrichum tofieldiae TaxID=708197 RepID=A0A161W3W8_9PEZI|nr:hypothetical protein CT0861_13259 [Colletotrichum tofieldiae]